MPKYIVESSDLTAIANAIRAKKKSSALLNFPTDFTSSIESLTVEDVGTKIVSGDIVNISDAAELNAVSCEVGLNPVQDLNGYDNPWPVGGGVSMAQFCDNDYTKTQNGLTLTYTKATETFSITDTNEKTDAAWLLFNNQDSFVCQPLTVGETYVFSHNLPVGTYSQVTYYTINSGTNSLVYLAGTGTFHSQSFTVPSDFSSVRAFQIGIAASSGAISAPDIHFEISKSTPQTWTPYSNICPISGHTSISVARTGKNLFDKTQIADSNAVGVTQTTNGFVLASKSDGTYRSTATSILGSFGGMTIYGKAQIANSGSNNGSISIRFRDANQTEISSSTRIDLTANTTSRSIVAPEGTAEIRIVLYSTTANSGSTGDTATVSNFILSVEDAAYEAYQGNAYTVSIPSTPGTVYGGTLDLVSGKLTVDKIMLLPSMYENNVTLQSINSYGIANFNINITDFGIDGTDSGKAATKCNILGRQTTIISATTGEGYFLANNASLYVRLKDSVASTVPEFKAWAGSVGLQLLCKLATPMTYQCTPQQIELLSNSIVFSNEGAITLKYYDNSINAILNLIPMDISPIRNR